MRYVSLFSGIEAASVAWRPLGWEPLAFAETEAFPSAVLAHRYPSVPNLGDVTKVDWHGFSRSHGRPDLVVFGSPCQSFSVAGKRLGLDDPRGNLALYALGVVDALRPKWFLFENVPGLLSSGGGRDFGQFLATVGECGYQCAWRILDAQYCRVDGFGRAVPQRRRRVFVVGCAGDWRRAAAVLFERESMSGNPAPRREAKQGVARPITLGSPGGSGYRNDADTSDNLVAFGGNETRGPIDVATARNAHAGPHGRLDFESETFVCAPPLTHGPYGDHESREGLLVAHALRADGFDASEDGTGRGTPLVSIAFDARQSDVCVYGDTSPLDTKFPGPAIAFAENSRAEVRLEGGDGPIAASLKSGGGKAGQSYPAIAFQDRFRGDDGRGYDRPPPISEGVSGSLETVKPWNVATSWAVRRLTPIECERLQGFPDGFTAVDYRGKPAVDGPRYKALGNSMAVNVMRWIGRRIEMIETREAGLKVAA